jgi:dTDP-4-dehydrorhamnose reductase
MTDAILIIGGSGLLGARVATAARDEYRTFATYLEHRFDLQGVEELCLDVTDYQQVHAIVRALRPRAVVLCGGMGDVEGCEADPERAFAVNAEGTRNVAKSLGGAGKLVYVSSNYIFNGTASAPYSEDESPSPLSAYGRSVAAAEASVREFCDNFAIARMATLWGIDLVARRPNFVSWVLGELLEGREVRLFGDQRTTPSYANQVAEVLLEIVRNDLKGVYNVVSQGCLTRLEMGLKIAEFFGRDASLIKPWKLSQAPFKAKRPLNGCLDCTKVEEALGRPMFTFEESLVFFRSEVQNYHFNWGRPQKPQG